MPIRPHPRTYECPQCGWSKTVAPRSDALMPGEHFSRCPSCGNTTLVTRPAAALSSTLSTLATGLQALSSLWRR